MEASVIDLCSDDDDGRINGVLPNKKCTDNNTNDHDKDDLKPLFIVGEEVVAAWWDNEQRTGKSQWFPGKIKSYKTIDSSGTYGPLRAYGVEFDDGDELEQLEDYWIFSRDDYQLMDRVKIGVTNVVDEECDDNWARITGWYVATIGDQEQSFSRLSDAMKAYDDYAVLLLAKITRLA